MSDIVSQVQKIKNRLKTNDKLQQELNELRELKTKWFLTDEDKKIIDKRLNDINNQLGIPKNCIEYSVSDISNALPKEMIIDKLLGRSSITLLIGNTGSGKTKLAHFIFKNLLSTNDNIFVRYIDMDNPIENLNSYKIHEIKEKYGERFKYFGKRNPEYDFNMVIEAENVILSVIEEQLAHPERIYLLIEDNLKNIARKNRKGFIDTNYLWKLEKKFQASSGTTIVLHHFNKAGIYADTSDILNFCDAAFYVSFNDKNSSIILEPEKQSRYLLERKAFSVNAETQEIIEEIEYSTAKMSNEEIKIINEIKYLLTECGDFNQSELEKELKLVRTSIGMGEKKFRTILKKYSGFMWENYRGENNALVFTSIKDKQKNQPNLPKSDYKDKNEPN
ncbi:AAA family ATPase [Aliarcobacter butzleri]|uniref:hypothetical protein n=1 Tax=Aliarcobacter butzleri TaxID=28197 RepID=UPI0021B45BC6|nr:hypothetical protein [Aliarcobacter butzleri]MCT7595774.1 hypothetical protein [Aliarcobacter butzleri]MCT7600278.1 hypothetical protein [Aliarcobacter butzleri]